MRDDEATWDVLVARTALGWADEAAAAARMTAVAARAALVCADEAAEAAVAARTVCEVTATAARTVCEVAEQAVSATAEAARRAAAAVRAMELELALIKEEGEEGSEEDAPGHTDEEEEMRGGHTAACHLKRKRKEE